MRTPGAVRSRCTRLPEASYRGSDWTVSGDSTHAKRVSHTRCPPRTTSCVGTHHAPYFPAAEAHRPEHPGEAVAAALVGVAPLGDRVLRPGQRRDAGLLDRPEDPDAAVVVEQVDPLDDLRVADHEPDPPAGHAEGLGHREHLDADLLRAGRGEEAARLAPVEDEVAVG